ncbi:DUF2291 family protein [Rhodopirellula halodulae]|uniref:DUF2291 family protein n=1 Tax=Rhodopirellula halodulae TaxID=2894198 RepID=UPI001E2F0EE8|nr:DUF2291 family protein [Rhodopirellula sp. JC737]MCC9654292.1 DUF2291 domain-containing protein [Rhodopirellula sp. JC737]
MNATQHRWLVRLAMAVVFLIVITIWPLFRIIPLEQADRVSAEQTTRFDASEFVQQFWTDSLLPSKKHATDAEELIRAIETDPATAKAKYGRSVGLSTAYHYFVSGAGRVVRIERNSIGIAIDAESDAAQIVLETGPVFGNVIRDGTGLLDVNDFANSRDFNAVSGVINRRVESEVLPELKSYAAPGAWILFVGCARISDEETDLAPMRVIPFDVETRK